MGEFNVNKSDGSLNPTAGMPETYPADQVMMSDGVTSVEDALDDMNKPSGSGAANRLAFREEITEITDEMWASIADGTFDKVHVGMHYTAASGRKYWFADADYYFGKSSPEQTSHHMLVVEDEISHTAQHQTTNVTTGGATASLIYTTTLPGIQSELNADFGESHILTQSLYLTNAISNNVASGGAYINKKAVLLNICQVMGHGLGYTEGTGQYLNSLQRERQLSLFQAMPETIVARDKTTQERQWYWCDDVISGSAFGSVNSLGSADYSRASLAGGVRRAFLIG